MIYRFLIILLSLCFLVSCQEAFKSSNDSQNNSAENSTDIPNGDGVVAFELPLSEGAFIASDFQKDCSAIGKDGKPTNIGVGEKAPEAADLPHLGGKDDSVFGNGDDDYLNDDQLNNGGSIQTGNGSGPKHTDYDTLFYAMSFTVEELVNDNGVPYTMIRYYDCEGNEFLTPDIKGWQPYAIGKEGQVARFDQRIFTHTELVTEHEAVVIAVIDSPSTVYSDVDGKYHVVIYKELFAEDNYVASFDLTGQDKLGSKQKIFEGKAASPVDPTAEIIEVNQGPYQIFLDFELDGFDPFGLVRVFNSRAQTDETVEITGGKVDKHFLNLFDSETN